MTNAIPIDMDFLTEKLIELLYIPSPTGMTDAAVEWVALALKDLGFPSNLNHKGGLAVELPGDSQNRPRALTAHVDTLGAMVKEIKSNGRLRLTKIGGFSWTTVEGEACTVHASGGEPQRGSLLPTKASAHVHGSEVEKLKRSDENLEVRVDARTTSQEETEALGISVGDFVSFDPRVETSPEGFIRSRHLDDKAGVACLLAAVKGLKDAGVQPNQRATLFFSNYEEVGHGAAAGFPADLVELVAVDMAAVGEGQSSDEFHTTICAKDSGGPYHYQLTQRLREIADREGIPHRVDTYPHYGSDAEAYWRAGGDVQIALIGPGVDASHSYERTHKEALLATTQLILSYLTSK